MRLLTLAAVALAIMCAVLAWLWTRERETAACWRAAAEFQLMLDGACET